VIGKRRKKIEKSTIALHVEKKKLLWSPPIKLPGSVPALAETEGGGDQLGPWSPHFLKKIF
jgi:hypothetical protein